jgi:signal transduction histidine kinase
MRGAKQTPLSAANAPPASEPRGSGPAWALLPAQLAGGGLLLVVLWASVAYWAVPQLAGGDAATEALLGRVNLAAFALIGAGALYWLGRRAREERRRLEAEIRAVEEMLQSAQKLEALGSLASSMAHDFNNTLAVIRGMVQIAELDHYRPESMQASLQAIGLASDRAGHVVRQLMQFLQHARDEFTAEDLNSVLRDFDPVLRHAAGKEMSLHLNLCPELPPVALVRGLFEHALLNLALNARDAVRGRPHRELRISTRAVSLHHHRSAFLAQPRSGRFAIVAVQDTGCGIPPDQIARVFEPFYTTKQDGTGLGLTSVMRVVRQHGGWLEVTSQVDQGTCFELYLPAATSGGVPAVRRAAAPAPSLAPEPQTGPVVSPR